MPSFLTEQIVMCRGEVWLWLMFAALVGAVLMAAAFTWSDEAAKARERGVAQAYRRSCVTRHDDDTLDLRGEP